MLAQIWIIPSSPAYSICGPHSKQKHGSALYYFGGVHIFFEVSKTTSEKMCPQTHKEVASKFMDGDELWCYVGTWAEASGVLGIVKSTLCNLILLTSAGQLDSFIATRQKK